MRRTTIILISCLVSLIFYFHCIYANEKTDNKFILQPCKGYKIVDEIKLDTPLYLKKRNQIWRLRTTANPQLLTELPNDKVATNCNMLHDEDKLYISHNGKIYAVNVLSGNTDLLFQKPFVSKFLGIDDQGTIIAIAEYFFSDQPNSTVLTSLVCINQSGVVRAYTPEHGSIISDAAYCNSNGHIALAMTGNIKFIDKNFAVVKLFRDHWNVRSLDFISPETVVCLKKNSDDSEVVMLGEKNEVISSEGVSAMAEEGGTIAGLIDDFALVKYNYTNKNWTRIISVDDCDNKITSESYASKPVISCNGNMVFVSLACHKIDRELKRKSLIVKSLLINVSQKEIYVFNDYYPQASW